MKASTLAAVTFFVPLALTTSAQAFGFGRSSWAAYSSYGPAPAPSYPAWGSAGLPPCGPAVSPWAPREPWTPPPPTPPGSRQPIPKEPTTREPPRAQNSMQPPTIMEASSSPGHTAKKMASPTGVCQVGFWNITGRDVNLQVAGRSMLVPRDRAVIVEVERNFAWQADDRQVQTIQVPEGQKSYEVIIR